MIKTPQTLEESTAHYWKLSRVWNGRDPSRMDLGEMFYHLHHLVTSVNPARPLSRSVRRLQKDVWENSPSGDESDTETQEA